MRFLKDTAFSYQAKLLPKQDSWLALSPQHCDNLIKLINKVGLVDFYDADLEVMAKICGGTSADFDRHAFTKKVLSTSHSNDEEPKTALTLLALNYKIGKMTHLAANIITSNSKELCFPEFTKTLIAETDVSLRVWGKSLKKAS